VKVKCPWCGARGTDREPYAHRPPNEDEKLYAFEVRGNYAHRPVRKCLNCGNGVRITFLPPRFRKVPPDEWDYLQDRWEQFKAHHGDEQLPETHEATAKGQDRFFAEALVLRRTDPDHFDECRSAMSMGTMQRVLDFEGEESLVQQGWSEDDASAAAVAAFLRGAEAQGLERR
jgi:hypothetical protein